MDVYSGEGVVDCVYRAGRDIFRDKLKISVRGPKYRQAFYCVGVEEDKYCGSICTIFLHKDNDRTNEL